MDKKKINVIYGLCTVGIGHAIRSGIILEYLKDKANTIAVTSGNAQKYLEKKFRVKKIESFEVVFREHAIVNTKTIYKNLRKISKESYENTKKAFIKLDKEKPTHIITDWETISSFYARDRKLPLTSIDNQHFIVYGKFNYPLRYKFSYYKAMLVLKSIVRKADRYIILTFPGNSVKEKKNVYRVNPILRNKIIKSKPKRGNYYLVYESTKSYHSMINSLKKTNKKFIIYGFDKNKVEGNLTFKKFSENGFLKDLVNCKGLISNCGFNLLSEAIYMKKPILAIPIKKHFEQVLNGLYIQRNKMGLFSEDLTKEIVEEFITNINNYKIKKYIPGNEDLFKIIDKEILC